MAPEVKDLPLVARDLEGFPWTLGSVVPSWAEGIALEDLPSFTIVMPSLNQGHFIEWAIRSILLQAYPKLEFMVLDGGSRDQTKAILERYNPWIDYWVSEPDGGQSAALNKGWARAGGDWFNWINSDDALAPNALWTLAELIRGGDYELINGQVKKFVAGFHEVVIGPKARPKDDLEALFWAEGQPAVFVRREAFLLVGPLNERLRYRMDLDWHLRYPLYFGSAKMGYCEAVLAWSNLHEECKTASQALGFHREWLSLLRDLAKKAGLAGETLLDKRGGDLDFSVDYESALVMGAVNLDKAALRERLDAWVKPFLDDGSLVYRQAAHHLLYQGVAISSLPLARAALRKAPWRLANWRCWWYAKRMAKKQTASARRAEAVRLA